MEDRRRGLGDERAFGAPELMGADWSGSGGERGSRWACVERVVLGTGDRAGITRWVGYLQPGDESESWAVREEERRISELAGSGADAEDMSSGVFHTKSMSGTTVSTNDGSSRLLGRSRLVVPTGYWGWGLSRGSLTLGVSLGLSFPAVPGLLHFVACPLSAWLPSHLIL